MTRSDLDRLVRKPSMKKQYNSAMLKNSFFHRSIYIYNMLTDDLRFFNKKKFSKYLKIYIRKTFQLKVIPKIPDKK